jgi:hypothetical protein
MVVIPGETANKFQQWLREQSSRDGVLSDSLRDLRKTIIDGFNNSISPSDAAALTKNRSQWKAFKTVEPILERGRVGTAGRAEGDIAIELLPEAVRKNYNNLATSQFDTPLADIAQVGSRLALDRMPRTGSSPRAMAQQWGLGGFGLGLGGSAAVGAALGGTTGAAAGGALTGLATMGANALMNSSKLGESIVKQQSRGLMDDASFIEFLKEFAKKGGSRAPIGLLEYYE